MKIRTIAATAAVAVAATGCAVRPPTVTIETPAPTDTVVVDRLVDIIYASSDPEQLRITCTYYSFHPETAWQSFDRGARGAASRDEFEMAMSEVCS